MDEFEANGTSPEAAYRLATELVSVDNPGSKHTRDQYGSSSVPIYQTAVFKQLSASEMGQYDYTRSGNPTRATLERHMAKIMKAQRALAVSTGMSCLDVITRLVKPGQEIVAGNDLYGGSNRLLKMLATQSGMIVHHVDTTSLDAVKGAVNSNTRLVLLESPTNPLIKVCDIPSISKIAHEQSQDCLVVVDNTMMSPILMNPLELGCDISYESATKYLAGHHDLMAGVMATNSTELGNSLYFIINSTGCGLAPFDSWLLLRGVKTLSLRMERQQANAEKVARYLESEMGFAVSYPGLPSHPQHKLHMTMARGAGAVMSMRTGSVRQSQALVEATRIFGISVSFGAVNSIISMPCLMSHASIDENTRTERGLPQDLIRICIGIEDVDDLISDLTQAIKHSKTIS